MKPPPHPVVGASADSIDAAPCATVERTGPVATITFATPRRANALNSRLRLELVQAVSDIGAMRPLPRAVVLRSPGKAFSSGADLVEQPASRAWDWDDRWHEHEAWRLLLRSIRELPAVVVARVQGAAVGGGALLALNADLRVASDVASIQFPEAHIGLVLPWDGPALLRGIAGADVAKELLLTGRRVGAEEAHRLGFFHRVAPVDLLDEAVGAVVGAVIHVPPRAARLTKAAFALSNVEGRGGWYESDAAASLVDDDGSQAAAALFTRQSVDRQTEEA